MKLQGRVLRKSISVLLAVMMVMSFCIIAGAATEGAVTFTEGSAASNVDISGGKVTFPRFADAAAYGYWTSASGGVYFPGDTADAVAGDAYTAHAVQRAANVGYSVTADGEFGTSVGVRFKGSIPAAVIDAADSLAIKVMPKVAATMKAAPADWYAGYAYTLSVDVADFKTDAGYFEKSADAYTYQLCIRGLSDAQLTADFMVVFAVTASGSTTYYYVGCQDYSTVKYDPREMSIADVLAISESAIPTYEVIVEGEIDSVNNTTYGNMYIKDANGNKLYIYGLYDSTGETRYDAMTTKPVVGDTIKVQSAVSFYNGTVQLKNAKLIAHTPNTDPVVIYETPAEIMEAAYNLGVGETLSNGHEYTLSGVVKSITELYTASKGVSFNMSVTVGTNTTKDILCYRVTGEELDQITVGDEITVTGAITNYNGTIEFATGGVASGRVDHEPPAVQEPEAEGTLLATFEFGDNGTATHSDGSKISDGSANATFTSGNYTLTLTGNTNVYAKAFDAKGNSCLKLGTSKAAGAAQFTVPDDVQQVVIKVAGYKANKAVMSFNGEANITIDQNLSNNGSYKTVIIDTSANKTVSFTTASGGWRAMINTIEYYGAAAE